MDNLRLRNLGHTILATFVVRIASLVLGIMSSIILARQLLPSGMGIYQLTTLVPLTLTMLFSGGISAANVYFVRAGRLALNQAISLTIVAWLLLSVFGLVLAGSAFFLGFERLLPDIPSNYTAIGVLLFPLVFLRPLAISLLLAREDYRRVNLVNFIVSTVAATGAIVFVLRLQWGVRGALMAFALSEFFGFVFATCRLIAHSRQSTVRHDGPERLAVIWGYGARAHLGGLLSFLVSRTDLFLVNFFLGPPAAGVYAIAILMGTQACALSEAASVVLFPRLSGLQHDEVSRDRLTPLLTRWMFLLSAGIAISIGGVGYLVILVLFGVNYLSAYPALLLFMPGMVSLAGGNILAGDLAARGRPGLYTGAMGLALVVNFVANIMLIPLCGITGAAAAATISYVTYTICLTFLYREFAPGSWWKAFIIPREDLDLLLCYVKSVAASRARI